MPDNIADTQIPSAAAPAQAATPAPAPPQAPSTPVSQPPAQATSGADSPPSAPASAPSAPVGAPASPSVRDQLAQMGLDYAGNFADDRQALQHLAQAALNSGRIRQLAEYGNSHLQHQAEFQEFLKSRQEREQQRRQEQARWWTAPEYDGSWAQKIVRDPVTGELRPAPGAPPDVVQKFSAWAEHQRSFLDKFSQDPVAAIRPGIEQVAAEVAERMLTERLRDHQERSFANEYVRQNSAWLYERGADGQPLRDPQTGRPQLSYFGQRFAGYVQKAQAMGVYDAGEQQQYAAAMVQRDALAMSQQGQPAPGAAPIGAPAQQPPIDPAQAAKDRFLAGARNAPAIGAPIGAPQVQQPAGNANGSHVPASNGVSGLREMMMRAMAENGFLPGQTIA